MTPTNRNFGLDLARTTAISLVLMSHLIKNAEFFGFWGVELFFSLSGFLIGGILWRDIIQRNNLDFKHALNFWLRRWYRTLPNYYLFLIIMILYHHYFSMDLKNFKIVFTSLWFGQNLFTRNSNFFGVSWSLCIEEWFYLLFPILILLFSKIGSRKKWLIYFPSFVLIILSLIVKFLLLYNSPETNLRGITFARLDAIVYGVLISYLATEVFKKYNHHRIFFILGIILFFLNTILFFNNNFRLAQVLLLIFAPLSCSFILPLLKKLSFANYNLGIFKIYIEKLSLWSYSIYLCHIPVLMIVYKLMDDFRDHIFGNALSKLIGLFFTLMISSFIYKKFELPILRLRPKSL